MSDEARRWSEVSGEEADSYKRDPVRRVAAPGYLLIVVGCLRLILNCLTFGVLSAMRPNRADEARPAGMDDETYRMYKLGQSSAPLIDCCLVMGPAILVYPLVIVGGLQMQKLKGYWLALLGAFLAMAPCSPAFLAGLPAGVWSLVVLLNSDVRAAFYRPNP